MLIAFDPAWENSKNRIINGGLLVYLIQEYKTCSPPDIDEIQLPLYLTTAILLSFWAF